MRYAYCAWVAVVSDAYRCLRRCRPRVSIAIKRNLNICQATIDDAVGLFQNITIATLIILENDSTMSCKKTYNFAGIMLFFEISIFASDMFVSKNRPKGHGI